MITIVIVACIFVFIHHREALGAGARQRSWLSYHGWAQITAPYGDIAVFNDIRA
jgi:hypothetical protein